MRLLAFAALSLAATPAAAQVVGVTAAVRNEVRITTPANPVLHRAAIKERVALGNDVITGGASAAQLLLLDQSSFAVGANARVRIDRFVYDPARGSSSLSGTVARGAFRFMSGRALHANPGQSSLKTPVASIGIRGTMLEGVVGPDAVAIMRGEGPAFTATDSETASLIVLRGPGRNAQGQAPGAIDVSAGGVTVPVEEVGFAVFVGGPDQRPFGPFRLSDRGVRALQALLRAEPQGRPWLMPELNPAIDHQFECPGGGAAGGGGGGNGGDPAVPPAGGARGGCTAG